MSQPPTPQFLGDTGFDAVAAGRKAMNLHALARAGFPVPDGFTLAPDSDVDALSDEALVAAVARIGGFPVAVRSSGTLEDLAGASFAGQYATFLDVSSLADLRLRVAECRASAGSPQVRAYLVRNGLASGVARVAVLIQRMVPARVAGVFFTIHPLTGREEHGLAEYCPGLGDRLVSGQTVPSRTVLELATGAQVADERGSEHEELSIEERRALCSRALEIQALFGRPQDLEWAIDWRGYLWILQSRPITTFQWREEDEEFTNADFKDGGVSARVCTPMMYSLYRDAIQDSMPRYLKDIRLLPARAPDARWIIFRYGRPYWNASAVKRALMRVPGFDEEKFDQDLGIQKRYGEEGPARVPVTLRTILRAVPVAVSLARQYRSHLRRVTAFRPRFLLRERAFLERIAAFDRAPDPDFWPECLEALALHHETETAYFTTIYNNSNAQTDFKSFLARMDAAAGSTTSLLKLISGLGDVSHMDIQRDLLALRATALGAGVDSREFVRGVEAFLERHYYHADAELDLLCPRWGEQPERVRQLVFLTMAPGAAPADPVVTAQQQREEYLSEAGAVDARLRARPLCGARFRRRFRRQLARVRSYLRAREEMRDCSTRAYHVVRRYLLEAGRRLEARGVLASAGHVFFLQTEDLSELARTSGAPPPTARLAELSERLRVRRLMHSGYRDLTPPNEFGRGVTQRNNGNALAASEGGARLQGLGSSPGLAEGPVRVIVDLRDSGAIRPGDILVTKFTDPGWTPILGLVSGIVTEVGGLLSHAAVIGREYGIPAVLNLPGATEVLRSGMRVQVNGDTGFVTVLPPHSGVSQPQDLDGARDSTRAIEAADSEAPPAARLR